MRVNARSREILKLLKAAIAAGEDGNDDAAAQLWLRCIELDDGTDATLTGAPDLPPFRLRPYLLYADYLRSHGDAAGAVGFLQWAIGYWPSDAMAYTELGRCYLELKDWERAASVLQRSIEVEPDANACVFLANALDHLGRRDDARWWLLRAITIDPEHDEAHHNLGCAYERIGDRDAAIDHLCRAIEIDPDYRIAHARVGHLLYSRAIRRVPENLQHVDWIRAIEHLTRAIELAPADGWSHEWLAVLHDSRGHHDAAEPHHQAATRLLPEVAIVWSHYGDFLGERGDRAEAERMLRLAVSMEPEEPDVRYWLGKYLWNAGDLEGGRTELRHAHRLGDRRALAWLRARDDDDDDDHDDEPRA